MNRNLTIGIVSGVATALALGWLFGTEKGKEVYRSTLDHFRSEDDDMGDNMQDAAEDIDYPNKTTKTVAE